MFDLSIKKEVIDYPCGEDTNCHPVNTSLKPGLYYFEVYGSAGGDASSGTKSAKGEKGGYASLIYKVDYEQTFYVYIGCKGKYNLDLPSVGGYNGGGSSTKSGAGGGGATDIRTLYGEWNNTDSLNSRILVAGGGSGGYRGSDCYAKGGDGGGDYGEISDSLSGCNSDKEIPCVASKEGCTGKSGSSTSTGGLGQGANSIARYGPGGGGGYIGGGSGLRAVSVGCGFVSEIATISYHIMHYMISYMKIGVNEKNGYAIITLISYKASYIKRFIFRHSLVYTFLILIK